MTTRKRVEALNKVQMLLDEKQISEAIGRNFGDQRRKNEALRTQLGQKNEGDGKKGEEKRRECIRANRRSGR